MNTLQYQSILSCTQTQLYDYHASGAALDRLNPPWENVSIDKWVGGEDTAHLSEEAQFGDISAGAEVHIRLKVGPISQRWIADHVAAERPIGFTDKQRSGPFKHFEHTHRFEELPEGQSRLVDDIRFRLPLAPLSNIALPFVRGKFNAMFRYRHGRTRLDLKRANRYADQGKKRILISGASGMIGTALGSFLKSAGHEVCHLVRGEAKRASEIPWNIDAGKLDPAAVSGFDAVVHLAGESIDGRWTVAKKKRIYNSRSKGTALLANALSACAQPPQVFVSASAMGIYGDCGERDVTEAEPAATGFLPEVCRAWEAAAQPAVNAGIRVVHPRIGLVVSRSGGAVKKMLPPFQFGLGGPVGSGRQWMSWIALDDLVGLLCEAMFKSTHSGPFNAVAPNPLRNKDFGKALGAALKRPAFLPLPGFVVSLLFGEMGRTLLLEGAKVRSNTDLVQDFPFDFPRLPAALGFQISGTLQT